MFESILCEGTEYDPDVLEPWIGLAVEIAREGHEARRVGTLFTLGDENAVLARSRPLILDPLLGHPEASRHVTNLKVRGTIKELAQLDVRASAPAAPPAQASICERTEAAGPTSRLLSLKCRNVVRSRRVGNSY